MRVTSGITFENELLPPFMLMGMTREYPEDWNNALTSEEFLLEAKKLLKKKFDDKNKVSPRRSTLS